MCWQSRTIREKAWQKFFFTFWVGDNCPCLRNSKPWCPQAAMWPFVCWVLALTWQLQMPPWHLQLSVGHLFSLIEGNGQVAGGGVSAAAPLMLHDSTKIHKERWYKENSTCSSISPEKNQLDVCAVKLETPYTLIMDSREMLLGKNS